MTTEAAAVKSPAQVEDEAAAKKATDDPYDFFAKMPNAPTRATLESWKAQAPNGRLRVVTPDGKRVFIIRAVGGMELRKIEASFPENLTPAKLDEERQMLVVANCTLWTNTTKNNRLNDLDLRAGSAGLPVTLFQLISWISDFIDPAAFDVISAEL